MCDVLNRLETSGVSRRNILASFGIGAAAVTLTACTGATENGSEKLSASRPFGPA
jgi:sporulation-control protein spo0M